MSAQITTTSLHIEGSGLAVHNDPPLTIGLDIPGTIQTSFGGKQNEQSSAPEGLTAVAELTGPSLETPIPLQTAPGYKFQIPGLSEPGIYYLQNIRLMKGAEFLQYATPSATQIIVADLLQTKIKVRQLSPEELRARGIVIDARNFDVYEFSFTFIIDGKEVVIPFPVVVDPRTHQVQPVPSEQPYYLPGPGLIEPPRWTPPQIIPLDFGEEGELPEPGEEPKERERAPGRPSIPAAIVIPNNMAVLHQFFAVTMMVTNGAPQESAARLENIRATMRVSDPGALRTVKTEPAVSFGTPVPIVEPDTGATFLVAQARGEAEWTLEGLRPGTHRIDFDLRATLKQDGQDDILLRAAPSASIVIHDPRFNITFSHPDVVRKGIEYSTYAFITNLSDAPRDAKIENFVTACKDAHPDANVCRLSGDFTDLMHFESGETRLVEYKLRAGVTGQVFATAGTLSDTDVLSADVKLHMGVSPSGIPLSPKTLVLPYYAQFVSPAVVSANLELFGLGYSLATAPLTPVTARFPRVIKTDVFTRAVDLSRAGQRIFITNDNAEAKRDSIAHLALDLLGNGGYDLKEWDALRRSEESGRKAGASIARELENTALSNGATMTSFIENFARVTAHRQGYVLAVAHGLGTGDRPYALELKGKTSGRQAKLNNEAASGWTRDLPYSDISAFNGAGEQGEIALLGRWTEDVELIVTPSGSGPYTVDVIYPAAADGRVFRARFSFDGGAANLPVAIPLTRGASSLNAWATSGAIAAVGTITAVDADTIRVVGARQDMHLDKDGHKVSVLFNRPVKAGEGVDLRDRFKGEIDFNRDGVVYKAARPISAAALQDDGRTVNTTFDHTLSVNATYAMEVLSLVDPLTSQSVSFPGKTTPKIDNDSPAGIVYGKVLKGDGTPISGADVRIAQYLPYDMSADPQGTPQFDVSQSDGAFLFEFIRRQIDIDWKGTYRLEGFSSVHGHTSLEGAVRLPGNVHRINLQFLGRGSAEGRVTYNDGSNVAGAKVIIGSTMFNQFRTATTDAQGRYKVEDLPVGPLTFSAQDTAGNVTYASNEIATPGQIVTQNLSIYRAPFPGLGRVYGVVRRSDNDAPVPGAHVALYSSGFGIGDVLTDAEGRFDFPKVPAGFITLLAAEFSTAPESVALDFDLKADEVHAETVRLFIAPPAMKLTTLTGLVRRERPNAPGTFEVVPGALVKIAGYKLATADSEGKFTYENVPDVLSEHDITAYDPVTQRVKTVQLPTLTEAGPNHVEITILAFDRGSGTIRVRLLNAAGKPVTGYRVIEPGFPPDELIEVSPGIYEMRDVGVGPKREIWAVARGMRPETGEDTRLYGDQVAHGEAAVLFNGHIAALTLRLPGQGTVRVKVRSQFDLISDVNLTYSVWDENEQHMLPLTLTASTNKNGDADWAVFNKIPAQAGYGFASAHPQYGYAGGGGMLAFDGDFDEHVLQLSTLSKVTGTVYAIDGVTPIAGATVRIYNGRSDPGPQLSGPDGRFTFFDQPSDVTVWVTAEVTQSGVYRIGTASAHTPRNGGVVENMAVILRKRGFVDGKVVYKDYKVFDPNNAANNVPDPTPNDYSDNAPVPLAKFYLRELDYPGRTFGTAGDPLTADAQGRFLLNNIFVGSLRATAWDSQNEELRGGWAGSIDEEGADATPKAYIPIGGGGVGELEVTVRDPNNSYIEVANADVTLYAGGRVWDLTTTGSTGLASFDEIPIGTYQIGAYSKALGKTSDIKTVTINRDQTTLSALELEFSGKVDGFLLDPEEGNAPVPGSHVRLTASNYQMQATTSGEEQIKGKFEFNGVRAGTFTLDAKDTDTNRRASAQRTLSVLDPHVSVNLLLEPTETLHFAAYLPDDFGNKSSQLAPPQRVEALQRCWRGYDGVRHCEYLRQLQGNPIQFPGLFENSGYSVGIFEPGSGEVEAKLQLGGAFPTGTAANPFIYVFPAYGDVKVRVTQGGAPASGVRLSIYSPGKSVSVYTDATGEAIARGLRLGGISIQASSSDGRFTGSTSVSLVQSSVMPTATIALGTYAGVTGKVIAEQGGPSVGTRVIANYNNLVGEARTDDTGSYTFLGIPTGGTGATRVNLTFIGPDDSTLGATTFKDLFAGDGVKTIPDIRIDATPPRFESINPEDNSINVSPDTSIRVAFSEPLNPGTIHGGTFQLVASDGSGNVNCNLTTTTENGLFTVVMTPPKPPTGFPLKSNTLYRVIVTNGVRDMTGHPLAGTLGFGFTTSDYTEPRVLKVLPLNPIPPSTTFEFRFNEPIDPAPWQTNGSGVHHVYKIAAPGGAGAAIVRELVSNTFLDPYNQTLYIALDDAPTNRIEPESFYRVVFNGVKDLQGNAMAEQTNHFSSYDEVAPHITFDSPAQSETLITGSEYEIKLVFRSGENGPVANDVKNVRFYTYDSADKPVDFASVNKAPFTVKIVGPEAPPAGTTFKLGARATDTSNNEGPLVTATWTVRPNVAPTNVVVTPVQAGQYPTKKVQARVAFEDEGSFVSVTATFSVPRTTGGNATSTITKEVHRLSNGQWESPLYEFTLPSNAKAGEVVTVTAIVSDVRGLTATPATATISVLSDSVQPQILLVSPPAGTSFLNTQKYTLEATVSDADTGVETVTFLVDGTAVATASSETLANGQQRFRSVQVETRSKADDANIPIVVTAKDYAGNTKSTTFELLYRGVNDPDAPKVAWLCPTDGGALPADTAIPLKLRVRAIDSDIRSVVFTVGTTEYTGALISGTSNEYGVTINNFTSPAGTLPVKVTVDDTVTTHRVELPITLDVIAADFKFSFAQAITADNVGTYTNKTIAVLAGGVLAPQVPVTLANLIVINGGRVETIPTTITREFKVDITTTGVTYVDCDSSVNVNEKGYVGGWQNTADGQNGERRGRTYGNQPMTGEVYGYITAPADLGSGGEGAPTCCMTGSPGGGAIALRSTPNETTPARIVIGGSVTADGGGARPNWAPGDGGSVWIQGQNVLFGTKAYVSALGGDDEYCCTGYGGGRGGRIAITATTKLDLATATVDAHGGYHFGASDADRTAGDGGGGTVYIRKPGQERGELTVSSYDPRFPNSLHPVYSTPLGRIYTGTSTAVAANALTDSSRTFTKWAIGDELVLAGNTARTFTVIGLSADARTLLTDPADGSLLDVATAQATPYQGLLAFDKFTAGKRALASFDQRVSVNGVFDDKSVMSIDPTAAVLLYNEQASHTMTTTPAAGGNVILDTPLPITYTATATAGVASVKLTWSPESTPRTDNYTDFPATTPSKNVTLTVPSTTPLGPATLNMTITDRAGRTYTMSARTYQIVQNAAPSIASFTIAPGLSIYAGRDVTATVNASDDISVKTISFDALLNGTSIKTQTFTPNTPTASATFTVTVDPTVAGGSSLEIRVAVSDGFAGRAPAAMAQTVSILQDTVAPTISVISPVAGASYREGVDKVPVRIVATDAEVKVKEAFAKFDGLNAVALTLTNGEWRADVTAPPVDGEQDVQRQITISAKDYAGNETILDPIALTIKPVIDANAPVLSWVCSSDNAMYPAGTSVKLQVRALAANAQNPVQKVEMFVDDSATSLTVASLGNNLYEATYLIPAATPNNTVVRVRAIATSAGGAPSDLLTKITVVVPELPAINSDTTIDASNTTYENTTVVVTGGTVTIRGAHTFDRLLVLGGVVTHVQTERLEVTTTRGTYVSCSGTIDVSARGYLPGTTYPGAILGGFATSGSHIGYGGIYQGPWASPFGSVYRPMEGGGGSQRGGYDGGSGGGGVVRMQAATFVNDGNIRANGSNGAYEASAGGSVWITAATVGGSGRVEARGPFGVHRSGGGGAIAVEYGTASGTLLSNLNAQSGQSGYSHGGPGSIYLKSGTATYGDLIIDNYGQDGLEAGLPSLGKGTAAAGSTGATLVTGRSEDVPAYFKGHWVEITSGTTVKGLWRILSVSGKTVTLEPNAGETIDVASGDTWQGIYRFDNLILRNSGKVYSADPIRTKDLKTTGGTVEIRVPVEVSSNVTIDGFAWSAGVKAQNLTVNGTLAQYATGGDARLQLDVAGMLTVSSTGVIDANGRGYAPGTTYPGAILGGFATSGSHIGYGGIYQGPWASTFGSVYRPMEAGGGAQRGGYDGGSGGGGVIRINAGTVVNDGMIRANGTNGAYEASAGGSVWITANAVGGTGRVEARGPYGIHRSGGGGAIAVEYATASGTLLNNLNAQSGQSGYSHGGPGSIYLKSAASTYGDLIIDNGGHDALEAGLPSLGKGTAASGTTGATLVTGRSDDVPQYFKGHWVEITSGTTLKGTWRIAGVNGKTVTLEPNGGETISLAVGDLWQGVYRFDNVTIRNGGKLYSADPVRTSNLAVASGTVELRTPVEATNMTIASGSTAWATAVSAQNLTIAGTIAQYATGGEARLQIDVSGTLTIAPTGVLDASGRGYAPGTTYPGETLGGFASSGAHIGYGGLYQGPWASTFGSVYRPREAGGGAQRGGYDGGSGGGGVIRITAGTLINDGMIRSNGTNGAYEASAGGSVWITANAVGGSGTVEARGPYGIHRSGGGGAIAIEYGTASGTLLNNLNAQSGQSGYSHGGPGSIYLKGGTSTYGDLIIHNGGQDAYEAGLPSLGKGTAQAATTGATLFIDRATDIPQYFAGHWVEITRGTTVQGVWRIASVSGKSVTLQPNAGETITLASGDLWQGLYLFDNVILRNGGKVYSGDPIRATNLSATSGSSELRTPIVVSNNATVSAGATAWLAKLTAQNLTVNGTLAQYLTGNNMLQIDVSGAVTVASTGIIDASGRGFPGGTTYPDAVVPGGATSGSHFGLGGLYQSPYGSTFGSVYRPREGGGGPQRGGNEGGSGGGGAIRITSGTLTNDGLIRANGTNGWYEAGAGGSVWITTNALAGTGRVEARGPYGIHRSGGGGAIAVEYSTVTGTILNNLSAASGASQYANGSAGVVYVKGPSSTYGDATVDNGGVSGPGTILPSLGRGNALAGTSGATVVTDAAANFPAYFAGHYVDILSAGGTLEGTWRIASVSGKTLTLEPNGSSTPTADTGDLWRGAYLFDTLRVRGASNVMLLDELRGAKQIESGSTLTINDPPLVNPSSIVVESLPEGDFVTGSIGAVQDLHQPVVVTIINNRTGSEYPAFNAAGDGSFRYNVAAEPGDTFSIRARDSFTLSATSRTYSISGAIVAINGIESVSITPSSVIGGGSVTGTVRMKYPVRRASEGVVTLLSSKTQATVPATVTIPAGASSISFPIATSTVSQDTPVQITASAATTSGAVATFTILAGTSALTDLQLSASSVEGGTSINGTATIASPSADGIVYLTSSNPRVASVPAFATIASGQTSVTFTVTTFAVGSTSAFSITASHGGSSITRQGSLSACTAMGSVAAPAAPSLATMWIDDAAPSGGTPTTASDSTFDTTQFASGSSAIHLTGTAAGTRTYAFTGATATMTVAPTDSLVLYALVNPCNPPREIVATWTAGTTEYAAAWGESRLNNAASVPYTRLGVLQRGGEWVRLEVPAATAGIAASATITAFSVRAVDGEAWIDAIGKTACTVPPNAPPSGFPSNESVWFDDELPPGAVTATPDTNNTAWQWTSARPASGSTSHVEVARAGTHQHYFTGATTPLAVGQGDVLFTYVYLDPCNPPREVMLQFNDGSSWSYRAYWGDDAVPNSFTGGVRTPMGPLPETGKWVRLEVPATALGLTGRAVRGMAFTLYDGQAWFDRAGKVTRVNVALRKTATQSTDYTSNDLASRAVDGNIATGHGSMSVTTYSSQPWWDVDLGSVLPIDTIDVYGRTDCCLNQTSSYHIFVSDVPFTSTTWEGLDAQQSQGVSSYGFPGSAGTIASSMIRRTGRYVRIKRSNTDHLSLPEVQVWTPPSPMRVNLAGGRSTSTTASSQWDGWTYPHFAVNGTAGYYQSAGSFFHIKNGGDVDPWWEIDLGSVQPIGSIEMWGRLEEAYPGQMSNVDVFVSDVPFTSKAFAATRDQAGVSMYHQPLTRISVNMPVERTGRYVRIQKTAGATATSFSFSEIYVWGPQPTLPAYTKSTEPAPER